MHYEWRYQERTVFLDDENALQTMQKTGDFEIIPYENEIDFGDTNRFKKLELGGADFILIATNTMHKIFDQIQKNIKIPD